MKAKQKQWQLYYLGFLESEADIDGVWGPVSYQGTRLLQEFFGITADGVFGTHTRNQTKSAISNIQEVLRSVAPNLEADGLAGPATVQATRAYQKANGLPVTGVADDQTWTHIQLSAAPEPQDKPQSGTFWDDIEYFTRAELRYYDYIYYMDASNARWLRRLFGDEAGKCQPLLSRDVADPWYTGDFSQTWNDITEGCERILEELC